MTRDEPAIGWVCSYIPEEVITATGCQSLLHSGGGEPVKQVDAYLRTNLCPYVRGHLDQALEGSFD